MVSLFTLVNIIQRLIVNSGRVEGLIPGLMADGSEKSLEVSGGRDETEN